MGYSSIHVIRSHAELLVSVPKETKLGITRKLPILCSAPRADATLLRIGVPTIILNMQKVKFASLDLKTKLLERLRKTRNILKLSLHRSKMTHALYSHLPTVLPLSS